MLAAYSPFRLRLQFLVALSCVAGSILFSLIGDSFPARAENISANTRFQLAQNLVKRTGINRGVVAVIGIDEDLPIHLGGATEFLVHVRDPSNTNVAKLLKQADDAGLSIRRLTASQGELTKLPYVSNMVDAVIATQADKKLLGRLSAVEVLRALRPGGKAIIGQAAGGPEGQAADRPEGAIAAADLQGWTAKAGDKAAQVKVAADKWGVWAEFTKPTPTGIDEWTHWEKSPDNNPVSADLVIKAPYMTQFMARPLYIGMPSMTTAAGGRTFLAIGHIAHHRREWDMLNKLVCRNGYNGLVLWERKLPEGYLVHRSAFVAGKDTFHMIDGSRCLLLDAATGKEKGEIRIPGLQGEWKYMAMQDGVLYVLAGKPDGGVTTIKGDRVFGGWSWADLSREYYGKRIPVGFGDTLAAYDLDEKKTLWLHKEETLIDSRGMAIRDGKVYLYCPDRHLRCLQADSGEVVWTNGEKKVFNLIEQPGKGLTSTPGWRTQTLVVATPEALIIQGQTRMNVVGVSSEDGRLLWTKRKITNNPNAIFVDNSVVLGVGRGGSHVVIDPLSGEIKENLQFRKTACTRLTATNDSFFCRGEGTLRFDRQLKKVLIDGAQRPACNDGAMPAHGLLYLGPWQCDCNLSLIGCIAKCSAGDFRFDLQATNEDRLETFKSADELAALEIRDTDWPTYRANNSRGSSVQVNVPRNFVLQWDSRSPISATPTPPVSAGGLIFTGNEDGKVRAISADNGELKWKFATSAPIKSPPTFWENRLYVGSGDGYVYCLEAATGDLLWRFRAAPVERQIMIYDRICSTWPVNTGVLIQDGVAYFGAGVIDHDGTYVYAVDAKTGKLVWQNNSSGHLNEELRKGVSIQGNLSVLGKQLLLAGGNQVSPAIFDTQTGQCRAGSFAQGRPKANNGRFVGVMLDKAAIVGGRTLYSAPDNVSTKGSFAVFSRNRRYNLNFGGVPPAWDNEHVAFVNFKHGKLTLCPADNVAEKLESGQPVGRVGDRPRRFANLAQMLTAEKAIQWATNLNQPNKFEVISLVVCPNAIVGVVKYQQQFRAHPQWYLATFDLKSGRLLRQRELRGDPLPEGLLVDREGGMVVAMLDGSMLRFAQPKED